METSYLEVKKDGQHPGVIRRGYLTPPWAWRGHGEGEPQTPEKGVAWRRPPCTERRGTPGDLGGTEGKARALSSSCPPGASPGVRSAESLRARGPCSLWGTKYTEWSGEQAEKNQIINSSLGKSVKEIKSKIKFCCPCVVECQRNLSAKSILFNLIFCSVSARAVSQCLGFF